MKHWVQRFKNGKLFLDHYTNDGSREKLFLPEVTQFLAGEPLHLEVFFEHSNYTFHTLAEVLLRRLAGRGSELLTGTLVVFIGAPSRSLMVAHARGQHIPYHARRHPRVPCAFPVTIAHRQKKATAEAVDYCPGGIHVLGGPRLEVGDAIHLHLHPMGLFFGLKLLGQIIWIQREPELAYGINLRPTSNLLRRRLNRLYEHLLARQFGN